MKKRLVTYLLASMCVFSLCACGRNNNNNNMNENTDPLTGTEINQETDSQTNETSDNMSSTEYIGTQGYDNMLGNASDTSEIIDYINTNAANATESDMDYYFRGLLDFGNDVRDIDFTRLENTRQYMSEDMIAFSDLMKLEADTPSMAMSD